MNMVRHHTIFIDRNIFIMFRNLQNALFGAVVGFLLACLAVIALEFYLDKVQSTEDLERRYDIPALGTIPDMDQTKRSSGRKVSVGR